MVAVAGLLLPVIGWQWTRDPQTAGHDQGAVGLGGYGPVGVQIHAPRVPKAPNRSASPHPTLLPGLGSHPGRRPAPACRGTGRGAVAGMG